MEGTHICPNCGAPMSLKTDYYGYSHYWCSQCYYTETDEEDEGY